MCRTGTGTLAVSVDCGCYVVQCVVCRTGKERVVVSVVCGCYVA